MKLLTYRIDEHDKSDERGNETLGVLSADGTEIYPLKQFGLGFATMNDMIEQMKEEDLLQLGQKIAELGHKKEAQYKAVPFAQAKLCAPIPRPRQDIICLGINYAAHAEESARYKKEAFEKNRNYAIYFSKRVNEAVADGGIIEAHEALVDSLDYEAELAVIIGKEAENVPKEKVQDYIFGYTIVNDVSARNVQTRHKQWYFGKGLDGFTPMGPWIVTKDEIAYPPALKVQSYVNGELRQNGNTDLLMFGIDDIVAELSSGMTLLPGTIISTGTPAGVGMGMTPPQFLKKGDRIECRIEGIGSITNTVGEKEV